jgi:hypothetical protein
VALAEIRKALTDTPCTRWPARATWPWRRVRRAVAAGTREPKLVRDGVATLHGWTRGCAIPGGCATC